MQRSAFTLLETIIVVALVVAISAVALPSIASRVAAGRVGHAVVSLQTSAAMARADAMDRGVTIALVAERIDREWVLFAEESTSVTSDTSAPRWSDDPRRREVGSFDGVEVSDELPSPESSASAPSDPDESSEPPPIGGAGAAPAAAPDRRELATFFADGSCRAAGPVYLIGEDGSRRVVRFGAISGSVDVRILPAEQDDAATKSSPAQGATLLPAESGGDR